MPVPKYYCDYCDKQFQDTPAARRRHLQGAMHQRAKKAWFDSFQDAGHTSTFQSLGQKICTQFMKTGFCNFGNRCRYQHPAPVQVGSPAGIHFYYSLENVYNRDKVIISAGNTMVMPEGYDASRETLPQTYVNLPPSLRPPIDKGVWSLPKIDWG